MHLVAAVHVVTAMENRDAEECSFQIFDNCRTWCVFSTSRVTRRLVTRSKLQLMRGQSRQLRRNKSFR